MNSITKQVNFFGNTPPNELVRIYGSPLYVYNESILRERCREMKALVANLPFKVHYSTKANSNKRLLEIIREEGLYADAMSPGEVYFLQQAGFQSDEIFYVSNNISKEEMKHIAAQGILMSVDSIAQLELFGKVAPGGQVAIRFNPGVGVGHHEKVVTGGKNTKFGVHPNEIPKVKELLTTYGLKLVGINQHMGSLFLEGAEYVQGVSRVLQIAKHFDDLEFIDLGGGFGIPYRKLEGQKPLERQQLSEQLTREIQRFHQDYGKPLTFKTEPGRYIVAECGVLLGCVHAVKHNEAHKYIGTDLGFNVLQRPVMYDAHHDVEVYRGENPLPFEHLEVADVVGNICESGDIIAKSRALPPVEEGDVVAILDAGAYGFSMSSNYNIRLRPAEVLVDVKGNVQLIRKRETIEELYSSLNV